MTTRSGTTITLTMTSITTMTALSWLQQTIFPSHRRSLPRRRSMRRRRCASLVTRSLSRLHPGWSAIQSSICWSGTTACSSGLRKLCTLELDGETIPIILVLSSGSAVTLTPGLEGCNCCADHSSKQSCRLCRTTHEARMIRSISNTPSKNESKSTAT